MITRWPKAAPLLLLVLVGGLAMGVGSCVRVTPSLTTLDVGEEVQLAASGPMDDAFTWRTTNPSVATVSEAGLVTGVGAGQAYITATGDSSGSVGRARVIVREGDNFVVTISGGAGSVPVGGTVDFNVASTDPDDTSFNWTSSNEAFATVDANGVVTGVAVGSVTISATGNHSGQSDSVSVQVTAANVTVTIAPDNGSAPVGGTTDFNATSTDPQDQYFLWSVAPQGTATIDQNGTVTGVAQGVATVTAVGNHSGASDTAQVTITPAGNQPPVADAGDNHSVPYNTSVTLDASGSTDPNDPTGASLTYAWIQTAGTAVTLGTPNAKTATFTAPSPGQYTFQVTVSDGALSDTATVTITAVNEAPTGSIELEGISSEDIAARGLTTGPSSGLHVVGVGTDVYLHVTATDPNGDPITGYAWTVISAPPTSEATIATPDQQSVVFRPDVRGSYELGVVVTDNLNGHSDALTQPIHAGDYVGIGIVNLVEDTQGNVVGGDLVESTSTCDSCHNGSVAADMITPWQNTKHATKLARDLNGLTTDHYANYCLACHTVGYNNNPAADNGGFDDVMADLGWTIPAQLEPGNWESMIENFPTLARLGNIQCENCHGPASEHPTAFFNEGDTKMGVSLDSGVCGQCHHEEVQWDQSGHGDRDSEAFTYPIGPNRAACVKCHSGVAYIDFATGHTPQRTSYQVHTCAVCHDPHSADHENQLRVVDSTTLPGDLAVDNLGDSATCVVCHNGRQAPANALASGFPHYSTASENLLSVNAVTYGGKYKYAKSAHEVVERPDTGQTKCVMCHMAPTPGQEHDGVLDPGEDAVGEHTFKLTTDNGTPEDDTDDFENVAIACAVCHPGLTTFNRTANGDYDGDGSTEGIQDEVQGLLDVLLAQLEESGVQHISHHPYWSGVTTDAQKLAIFNFELINHDGSHGVHNAGFAVGVLQATYKEFTGVDVPGATLRYQLAK